MWEMGNRLLSKIGVRSTPSVGEVMRTPVQSNSLVDPLYPPLPNLSNEYYQPPIQYHDRYAGYAYHDSNRQYPDNSNFPQYTTQPISPPLSPHFDMHELNREITPIASSSTSSPIPSVSSPSVPKKRAPRKTNPPPMPKPKVSIFDACQDASYTRLSGVLWPDPDWIPSTPYKNKMIYAKVVDVYDGDTFTVIIMYGDLPMKLKIRLQGVDAPELVVKKQAGKVYTTEQLELIELEMRAGAHVRDKVKKLIEGKEVIVKLIKCDKYGGRQVGAVYLKPQSYETLTEYLLSKRYGKPYQAQKKEDWSKSELTYILEN